MTKRRPTWRALGPFGLGGLLCLLGLALAGCSKPPPPRSFADFMEDRIAMEGALARCNQNRDETHDDIECANARRASMAIALTEERARREELERESERKLAALRAELSRRERAEREAAAAAEAAKQAAYEAQWNDKLRNDQSGSDPGAAVDGLTAAETGAGPDLPVTGAPAPRASITGSPFESASTGPTGPSPAGAVSSNTVPVNVTPSSATPPGTTFPNTTPTSPVPASTTPASEPSVDATQTGSTSALAESPPQAGTLPRPFKRPAE